MTNRLLVWLGAAAVLTCLAVVGIALTWPWEAATAKMACRETGPHAERVHILIVGDSWANASLDVGMISYAAAWKIPLKVCKVGYAGATSARIVKAIARDGSIAHVAANELAGRVDALVLVDGVNDAGRHVGADRYGRNNARLLQTVAQGRRSFILELPHFFQDTASPTWTGYWIHRIRSCLFDACRWDVEQQYRQAMEKWRGPSEIIPFGPYVACYAIGPGDYKNGAHLTKDGFIRLGRYIGARVLSGALPGTPGDPSGCGRPPAQGA